VAASEVVVTYSADVRYVGQGHEVTVPFPAGTIGPASRQGIVEAFEDVYRRLYGRVAEGAPLEVVNWRVTGSGPVPSPGMRRSRAANGRSAVKGWRPAYFAQYRDYYDTPVYDRYGLGPGDRITGPAIVEERESTAILGPGAVATVDELSNLIVRLPA